MTPLARTISMVYAYLVLFLSYHIVIAGQWFALVCLLGPGLLINRKGFIAGLWAPAYPLLLPVFKKRELAAIAACKPPDGCVFAEDRISKYLVLDMPEGLWVTRPDEQVKTTCSHPGHEAFRPREPLKYSWSWLFRFYVGMYHRNVHFTISHGTYDHVYWGIPGMPTETRVPAVLVDYVREDKFLDLLEKWAPLPMNMERHPGWVQEYKRKVIVNDYYWHEDRL